MRNLSLYAAFAAGVSCAGTSAAQTFTFDSIAHGEILTNQFAPAMTMSGQNFNRSFDILAGFDTNAMGTSDPDLQGPPWSAGNLAISDTETNLGTAVILAENDLDANGDGILDDPDDEGRRPAGLMDLGFASPIPVFGLDIIDIEGRVREFSSLDFFAGGLLVGSVAFEDFEDPASPYFDPSVVFGNNTANRISPIAATDFGVAGFDRVVINIGGSSAYDTFVVPAPASAALLGLGGLAAARRRR
ncbi:MAG: PEP-CTERM sorting domain-containing protein [Planctomycetota bacterium]